MKNKSTIFTCCLIALWCSVMVFYLVKQYTSPKIGILQDTVNKSPQNPRINHIVGTAYLQKGDLGNALKYLWKAKELSPSYPEPYNNIGLVFFRLNKPILAKQYFTMAISLRHNFLEPYINLATIYLKEKNYGMAEALLEKSLKIRPTEEAYLVLGNLHMEKAVWSMYHHGEPLPKAKETPCGSSSYKFYDDGEEIFIELAERTTLMQ